MADALLPDKHTDICSCPCSVSSVREDNICVCQSPADDLLLAVVVSSLDALGHVSQSGEARLSGQSVCGEGFQTPAGRLSLLQGGESSDVLPPDQTQRVLQVPFPQRRLREEDKDYLCLYPSEFREQHTHTSAVLLHRLVRSCRFGGFLPSSQTSGRAAPGSPGGAAPPAELALAHVQLSPAKPNSSRCRSGFYLQIHKTQQDAVL